MIPDRQIPGVIHRRVGDVVVTALSDGYLDGSLNVLRNIGEDEARRDAPRRIPPGAAPHLGQLLPDPPRQTARS